MGDWLSGRNIICAAKHAVTWRIPVECGANDGLLITSEGGLAKSPVYLEDESLGQSDIKHVYKVADGIVGGTLAGNFTYEGWDVLLAHALGETDGAPSQESGSAYYNIYSAADQIDGKFCTIAMKKKDSATKGVWEVPSAKITGFTIRIEVGVLSTITVNFMGNKIRNQQEPDDDVALANTRTTMGNVTYWDSESNVVLLDSRSSIKMNSQSGAALDDGDRIYPRLVEITYTRPFRENREAAFIDMSEPIQNGFAASDIRLEYDKYDVDDFVDAISQDEGCSDSYYKMEIALEGCPVTTGDPRYQCKFYLPRVHWRTGDAPLAGADTLTHVVTGRMLEADSVPTGFPTGTATPINIFMQNTRTVDPIT